MAEIKSKFKPGSDRQYRILNRSVDRELFGLGAMIGVTCLSIALASVPRRPASVDGIGVSQGPSEIGLPKEGAPNFDKDIQRLSQLEPRYRERLPIAQSKIRAPIARISKKPYHPAIPTQNASASSSGAN